ncbi:MAG: zinc-ribbon domain-containing protein [Clostridia bacterium]|nr:zinc-ribbon domain-containing protein [Clostridia bacterium]
MKFCTSCGAQLHNEARFCSYCGEKQLTVEDLNTPKEKAPAELIFNETNEQKQQESTNPKQNVEAITKKRFSITSIIRNSIILFIATLLLTFSFLPVINISEEYRGVEVQVNFSPIDNIIFMFDSFQSVEPEDSEIYEEIGDLANDIDNYDNPEGIASRLVYLYLRFTLQSDNYITYPSLIFTAIFSFIYIIACIAFFVVSLFNLLNCLEIIKKAKNALNNWTITLLCAMPCLFLALYYIMYAIYGGSSANTTFSALSIISLVLICLTIVMVFVFRLIFSEQRVKLKLPARIVATCLSIIVICLAFAPVVTFDVRTEFSNSYTKKSASNSLDLCVFTALELDNDTWTRANLMKEATTNSKVNYFEQLVEDGYSHLSKFEAEDAIGSATGASILSLIFAIKTTEALTGLMSQAYILFLIVMIGALMVLWQNLVYFALGKEFSKTALIGKIISGVASALALIASIIYVVYMSSILDTYIPKLMSVHISAGIIILAIFALGSIFCPIGKENKRYYKIVYVNETETKEI